MRLLLFPEAAGYVSIYDGSERVWHGPALGTVAVEEGHDLLLTFETPARGLDHLPPDAVQFAQGISKKRVTDDDLACLAHLTGLRELWLSKASKVTDAGVARLAGLRNLTELDLYSTGLTDAGMAHLRSMTDLTHLHLGDTRITGPGLQHLARMQRLVRLSIEDTDVGDDAVPHLLKLRSLQTLAAWRSRLTTAGVAALRRALPKLNVEMPDPGRRVALERGRSALFAILAGRLAQARRDEAGTGLAALPPGARIVEWRISGQPAGGIRETETADVHEQEFLLRALSKFHCDFRIVADDGTDQWVPWLRSRSSDRRRARRSA